MMLCVPSWAQFALVEGVVQLWSLEPGHKCWFLCSGDQVWACELVLEARLAFCPQVAHCFSPVPVLCALDLYTHKSSVSCCFTIDGSVLVLFFLSLSWRCVKNACGGMLGIGVRKGMWRQHPWAKCFRCAPPACLVLGESHTASAEER